MAINQIQSTMYLESHRSQVRLDPGADGKETFFDEILAAAANSKSSNGMTSDNVETAAEILRLRMLRSAVSIGESDPGSSSLSNTQSMHNALAKFIEQEQQNPATAVEVKLPVVSPAPSLENKVTTAPIVGNSSIETIINNASKKYGVNSGLIKAVIKAESNFNSTAVSHAGAQGLMQLMPATARGLGVTDSFDAEQNVMAGTRFLKDMLNRYGGDVDSALAAYNWGPGNVDKRGDFLPKETREYLVKVKKYYNDYTV